MVTAAGADCVLGRPGTPSERIRWQEVSDAAPDVVVVAPCGYHLEAAAALARDLDRTGCLPAGAALWAVDADAAFVRPGPRVIEGVEALAAIAHPDVIGATALLTQQIGR
jgi:iron complex transport system substrate-binding protein